jgi:hypothetical protein
LIFVAAALWLSQPVAPPPHLNLRRVFTSDAVHIGIAANVLVTPDERAAAVTVQISFLHIL